MLVALIGDVHGNLPALEAVLADAEARGAGPVWNVGDFTGYGPFPDEVVKRLQQPHVVNIIGNYDQKVLKFERKSAKWRKSKLHEKWLAFGWAWEHLSQVSRDYLRSLPEQRRLEVKGRRVLLCHGSPESVDEHLWSATPEKRMRQLAAMARADLVVCGHSHEPFRRDVQGVVFVNTGSVGRPDDGDPRASYALAEITRSDMETEHLRVAYDLERVVQATRRNGLPEAFAEMLLRGRNLDSVLSGETRQVARPRSSP
jgi:putative phosphoesterase